MSDPIERQAAIEILYNFAGCVVDTPNGDYRKAYEASRYELETLPSAQPEIIYCKKCKHWTETCGDEQWALGDCDVFEKHLVMCNGYCAWAERREE